MTDQWKLVPVKPTPEMVNALWDALPKGFSFQNCTPIGVIASIIDAAPTRTQGADDAQPVAVYQLPNASQIYAAIEGVAATRTSPENICDVLAIINRLRIAASAQRDKS